MRAITYSFLFAVYCCTILLLAVGCKSSNFNLQAPNVTEEPDANADIGTGQVVASKEGFELLILDESFGFGGSATFNLEVSNNQGSTEVVVIAEAEGLRACYLELSYDGRRLHPVAGETNDWPGVTADRLLHLTVLNEPDAVHHGTIVARPQDAVGAFGSFVPLTVTFADGPALADRSVAAVPDGANSVVPDLSIDRDTGDVTFSYCNVGDYNQDGLVSINDLTPLGFHFEEESPVFPLQFPFAAIGSVVDGNFNGLIEIADITPLGQNFNNRVTKWLVYGGVADDYASTASEGNGMASQLGTVAFDESTTLPNKARLAYSSTIPALITFDGEVVWLRPVGDEDDEGIASHWFAYDPAFDLNPPEWTHADGVGVLHLVPLDEAVRVMWGEATDRESPPVTYTVYYNEGDFVDFETAQMVEVTVSDPPDASADQITEIGSLANNTQYAFAVRAKDSATTPNEEANIITDTATPLATAEMPSAISEETVFDGPMVISDGNSVEVTGGETLTFLSDLTIENSAMLNGADEDLSLIVYGKFVNNGAISHTIPDTVNPGEDAAMMNLVLMGGVEFGASSQLLSNGNVQLVDHEGLLATPEEIEIDTASDANPEDYEFNWMMTGEPEVSQVSTAKAVSNGWRTVYFGPRPWQRWIVSGNWGGPGPQPSDVQRVVLRANAQNGQVAFIDFSVDAPPGAAGKPKLTGMNITGNPGEDARFSLRFNSGREMYFDNVTFNMGDGGRGGYAATTDPPPPSANANATGGKGGDAKNAARFTSNSGGIHIMGEFRYNLGSGGDGGDGDATGGDGKDDCPPDPGGSATATGGAGGEIRVCTMSKRGNVTGTANIVIGGDATGGFGGLGYATGGDGGAST